MTPIQLHQQKIALTMTINETLTALLNLANEDNDTELLQHISKTSDTMYPLLKHLQKQHKSFQKN